MQQTKLKTIEGEIVTGIRKSDVVETTTGKRYWPFFITVKGESMPAVIWERAFAQYKEMILSPKKRLLFSGFEDDFGSFSVVRVASPEQQLTAEQLLIREYGSPEEAKKARDAAIKRNADAGRVWVSGEMRGFQPVDQCVNVGGTVKLKLSYCMDVLGGAEVTKRMRERKFTFKDAFNVAEYKKFIEAMVAECRELQSCQMANNSDQCANF